MANRTEQLKTQVEELWRGAVAQATGVGKQLQSQTEHAAKRVRGEIEHLRTERTRLLTRLGEQTLRWVNARSGQVPTMLKPTVDRLNTVVSRLVNKGEAPHRAAPAHHAAPKAKKKASAKRAPAAAKKPAAKVVAKKVSKAPVARKTLRDEPA